jgi:hypothetical protein
MTKRISSRPTSVLIAILACSLAALAEAATAPAPNRIAATEAAQHVNEQATVCGLVAGAKYASRSHGQPTFLDFEKPYPGEVFRAVIWGSDLGKFPEPPERAYGHGRVCVTGKIQLFRGVPEIIVHGPAQLALDQRPGG